ncbi:MAG: alpha-L-fucosidase [Spirochaetota bacterium]
MRFGDGREFFENRFGMFIHWGLYSINGWHEQDQWRRAIPKAQYVKLAARFNPVKYDPVSWMKLVRDAGMSYICFTTKHHDGFCLWNTKQTEYNVMNTPYNRDVLAMLADACAKTGVKLGLYYSCPDWHHPYAPRGGDHELPTPNEGDTPDEDRYIEYVRAQMRELATNYGQISNFFWDIPPKRNDPSLNAELRKLQPGIMINDRGYDKGDYDTPERHVPAGKAFTRPTEACQSVGRESWGYRADEDYYSSDFVTASIDKILAMGGNYLLNVGPKGDGTIPAESARILRAIGKWYKKTSEAFVGAECASQFTDTDDFLLTMKDNAIYVHFHRPPASSGFVLYPIDIAPKRATVLNTGARLNARVETVPSRWQSRPLLHVSGIQFDSMPREAIIIKLEFDRMDIQTLEAMAKKPAKKEYIG